MQRSKTKERQQVMGVGVWWDPTDGDTLRGAQQAGVVPGRSSEEAKPCLPPAAVPIKPDQPTVKHGFLYHG